MRILFFSIALSVLFLTDLCPNGASAAQKYAIYNLAKSTPVQLAWLNERFTFRVGGTAPNNSSVSWIGYYDILGLSGPAEANAFKDWAVANGVNAETAFMHAKINYVSTINPTWNQMDKFDIFEGANGILKSTNSTTFTDVTSTAYASSTTLDTTYLYVGYEEPFDQVNFTISRAGVGGTVITQFWNGGGWATLTSSDGTGNLGATGQIHFTPHSTWSRTSINGSRTKYFIRLTLSGYSTVPITSKIYGDSWRNGSTTACRGWSFTDSNRVNQGTPLEYNPNPPAGAAANFPYQARLTFWAANHFVMNPADTQSIGGTSKRTWSQFIAFRVNQLASASGWSGVMGDDGASADNFYGITSANTDFADKTANSWDVENVNKYSDLVSYSRTINPLFKIGLNGQLKTLVPLGDFSLAEYFGFVRQTRDTGAIPVSDRYFGRMTYDDYLPANNPTGALGMLIYDDTVATVMNGTVPWDRSNRGPIVALSKHLIAANDNTYFAYFSRGGYYYSEIDDVVLNDDTVVHLATQPVPALSDIKRWGMWFPAMGLDFGVPDVNGWNGGVRSFTWKLGTAIGGGLDVWRRDYTNAIVLHRPAMYNTTALQYTTPSSPFDLGGTYYPLFADGSTGEGITSIALKHGEGAILMKSPVVPPPTTPPPTPPSAPKNLQKK